MTRSNQDPNLPLAGTPRVDVTAWSSSPVDRVRWGAVIAGIFAALSLLVVLFVLGAAIGLSAYDAGDQPRSFAIGATWWAAVSSLIAFAFGGWVAARTAAVRGPSNGMLNGAMVWAVAIPLSLMMFTSGVASMLGTAANVSSNVAANPQVSSSVQQQQDQLQSDARQASAQLQAQITPQNLQRTSEHGARAAWGTLASLLLGLIAASVGGWVGARPRDLREERWTSTTTGGAARTSEGM